MKELINFLNDINNGQIPVHITFSQDFANILAWSKDKKLDKNAIRAYLVEKELYTNEEDLEYFMRDIYTSRLVFDQEEHKKQVTKLLNTNLFTKIKGQKISLNQENIRCLINEGFKCYPVSYDQEGIILGIITRLGHIVI